ncbi:MAG: Alanine racemase, biosynthetic [Alphaproteobacteria bacterium MarineAlpha9_Bin4]|nr:alanine racemase [Pelagibacterales bacterium]PPR25687.1 MAG: Alanine racemase, biosynthetic [Alphaproteobacteria bacterium MarineAlpha9_Bin4]
MISKKLKKFNINSLNNSNSAVLTVSLESIKSNYNFLKKKIKKSEIGASVKADAYGLGHIRVCKTLIELGCKNFFVANYREGLEIIKIKKNLNVFILNGVSVKKEIINLIRKGINIVINNMYQLDKLILIAKEKKLKAKCALHIDTGMNRLGLDNSELEKIIMKKKKYLKISLIMSHLTSSENKNAKSNSLQLKKFRLLKRKFEKIKNNFKFSLANSNGILLNKNFHFSLCRPGGLIFGLNLTNFKVAGIKNVISLYAKVIQIKFVNKGDYVGYGGKYKAKKNLVIAILGIGYADGLPRAYSGSVYYKNYIFPIIGNISMDLCTIDISSYKKLKINDWVEIFGNSFSIEEFANNCNTITYEISSKIGPRVKKIYI